MANDVSTRQRRSRGFSLVELLIVVAIIAITAAVALPNIGGYIRNYKIRGAARQVADQIQTARSRAITSNTDAGVSFFVLDYDSFRFVQEDLPSGEQLAPIQELPNGVRFVVATGGSAGPSVRFNRLGNYCNPAVSGGGCAAAFSDPCPESARCTTNAGASFIAPDPRGIPGGLVVTLEEVATGLRRTVRLAPGGRILPQP